jgi:hypothetical protein
MSYARATSSSKRTRSLQRFIDKNASATKALAQARAFCLQKLAQLIDARPKQQ